MLWLRPRVIAAFRQHVAPRIPRAAYVAAVAIVGLAVVVAFAQLLGVGRWVVSAILAILGASSAAWRARRVPRLWAGLGGAAVGAWVVWAWAYSSGITLLCLPVLALVWWMIGVEKREPVTMPDELVRRWRHLTAKGQPLARAFGNDSELRFDRIEDSRLHYVLQVGGGYEPNSNAWGQLETAADKTLGGVAKNSLRAWQDERRRSVYHVDLEILAAEGAPSPTEGGEGAA